MSDCFKPLTREFVRTSPTDFCNLVLAVRMVRQEDFPKLSNLRVSILDDQFLKLLFGSHGVPGCGVRSPAGVSAKYRCSNQCTRSGHDLKDVYPVIPPKEYSEARVAHLLSAIHSTSNPAVPFNPAVFI